MGKNKIVFLIILFSLNLYGSFEFSIGRDNGVRLGGMGGAYVAIGEEPEGGYINPAGIAQNKIYKEVSIMYGRLFNLSELTYSYIGLTTPDKGKGSLGLNVFVLGFSNYYSEKEFGAIYSRRVAVQPNYEVYFGAMVKLLHRLYDDKADSFSIIYDEEGNIVAAQDKVFSDINLGYGIGVLYSTKMDRNLLRIGASYRANQVDGVNVGTARVGVAYNLEKKAIITADYDVINKEIAVGGEYNLVYRLLDIRAGYQQGDFGSNITFGSGITLRAWRFDLAYILSQSGLPPTYKLGCVAKF